MPADATREPPPLPPDDDTAALLARARKIRERGDALLERAERLGTEAGGVIGRLQEQARRELGRWRRDPA